VQISDASVMRITATNWLLNWNRLTLYTACPKKWDQRTFAFIFETSAPNLIILGT